MLELVSNKKYVAHNVTPEGEFTCFCKYSMLSNGNLIVDYFMPKQGFSLLWSIPNDHKTMWFNCFEDEEEIQFQFGKKLLNEYRTI